MVYKKPGLGNINNVFFKPTATIQKKIPSDKSITLKDPE